MPVHLGLCLDLFLCLLTANEVRRIRRIELPSSYTTDITYLLCHPSQSICHELCFMPCDNHFTTHDLQSTMTTWNMQIMHLYDLPR